MARLDRSRHTLTYAHFRVVLIAATVLAVTLPAAAQMTATDLADATLDELMRLSVTTASRTSETLLDAPARMNVITDHQIRRRGYRSLGDVLKDLPDFKIDFGGDPDYPVQLTVQGTRGAKNVIVMLDGVRVSSPTNEPLPILYNYPVHSAQQIEIVYGPASALYGADAFSAVINIISKDATDQAGLTLETAAGQFGLYNQTGSYTRRVGRAGSLLLGAQVVRDQQPDLSRYYAEYGGLQAQRAGVFETIFGTMFPGSPISPEYQAPISGHSLQATLRAGGFHFSVFQNQSRNPTAMATDPNNAAYVDQAFNRNKLLVGSGSYTRRLGAVSSVTTLTASSHELDPQSGYMNVFSLMTRSYKYAHGSMLKAEEQLSWKPTPGLTLTTGATAERFFAIPQTADLDSPITSRREAGGILLATDLPELFYKLRYTNSGAYGQAHYTISPRLALTLGARGDYNSRYGGTFNPRIGLVTQLTPATTAKVLFGTAYLAPSPYQAYAHYGSFYSLDGGVTYQGDYSHVPNPDLKPEKKSTIETTVQHAIAPSISVSASAFSSHSTNLIQESDPDRSGPGVYRGWPVAYIDFPVNEGDATSYGGTLGLDVQKTFARGRVVDFRAALSVVDGHLVHRHDDVAETVQFGGMSPWQMRVGADVRWDSWTIAPRVALSSRQRTFALADDDKTRLTIPGYTTLQVELRRVNVMHKGLELFTSVENAFDNRYRHVNPRAYTNPEELIGAPQNPRRLTIGARLQIPR
jgi:outer membrane receptor for ferrienterochelin and colicin